MMGFGDGNFGVNQHLTRRQPAVVFVRRFQLSIDDVPTTDWAYPFVEALSRAGITAGCTSEPRRFCPEASVSRAEFAVMMIRAMQLDVTVAPASPLFTDVPPSHWAFSYVQLFASLGITQGCATMVFCPTEVVSRGQAAVFLARELMIR